MPLQNSTTGQVYFEPILLYNSYQMALALYRKYRPKDLASLVGHETNIQILKNAAKLGKLGQSYLFFGPRGTGKTTTARLVAKLLNCERRKDDLVFRAVGEPCNECVACKEIDGLNSLDVIEIDAASNRGIDEIRNLKESVRQAPTKNPYKVYIIDEAHMLTGTAFNALLKTLEEPPAHAVFILATTEFEKLPATITSRTQRFLFKKLSKTEILVKLSRIVKSEKLDISPDALELIASASEGSLRDAESLLDQISNIAKKIDLTLTEEVLGRAALQKVEDVAELILGGKSKEAIKKINDFKTEGLNLVQLTKDLIHYLEKVLTLSLNPDLEKSFSEEFTKDELDKMKKFVELAKTETILPLLRSLIRAYGEMRYSPFAAIPLEIALMETT
jgi:DNA polymerase-3 subunit gamma/tau